METEDIPVSYCNTTRRQNLEDLDLNLTFLVCHTENAGI
jgi:hypothetical protein